MVVTSSPERQADVQVSQKGPRPRSLAYQPSGNPELVGWIGGLGIGTLDSCGGHMGNHHQATIVQATNLGEAQTNQPIGGGFACLNHGRFARSHATPRLRDAERPEPEVGDASAAAMRWPRLALTALGLLELEDGEAI